MKNDRLKLMKRDPSHQLMVKRTFSEPLLSEIARQPPRLKRATWAILVSSIKCRSCILLISAAAVVYIITSLCHVYTFFRAPNGRSLPDVIADIWPTFGLLRSGNCIIYLHASTFVTFLLFSLSLYFSVNFFSIAKIKKSVFICLVALALRCVFVLSTQLPPPCAGFSKCKCAEISYNEVREKHSVVYIAMLYIVTFGLGTDSVPKCGDMMMSYQTTFQTCLGMYFIDLMQSVVSETKYRAVKIFVFTMISISAISSVMIRKEYTISVALAVLVVLVLYKLYYCAQIMQDISYGPFLTSTIGMIFSWFENETSSYRNEE